MAPPVPERLTPKQRIEMWLDLMDSCEQFLLAGLRQEVGLSGDVTAAYRQWYSQQMQEHDRTMLRMMQEFHGRRGTHAG